MAFFEYSECHHHFHFTHYGDFYYADEALTAKMGFCLVSTERTSNNELQFHSILPYDSCTFQGVAVGWADQYKIGPECQWVDVTHIDTTRRPVTELLSFSSNPDGFLCEGESSTRQSGSTFVRAN